MRLIILSFLILLYFLVLKILELNTRLILQNKKLWIFIKMRLKSMEAGQYLIASEKFDQSESLLTSN